MNEDMDGMEELKDWTFRYQYLYGIRRSNKQKQRFLSAMVADIMKKRQDIQVMEYQQNKKYVSSNLYVGNIETADKIICAYYDTPPVTFSSYYLFDRKKQRDSLTAFILVSTIITLVLGVILTLVYMKYQANSFDFRSIRTVIVILCYGLYFYGFNKIAKGLSIRNNLVRNTSSILTVLTLINNLKGKKTAFAFVDEGCFGERGLDVLRNSCKPSAKIFTLDCVGANAELHFRGQGMPLSKLKAFTVEPESNGQVSTIFCGDQGKRDTGNYLFLNKKKLKNKQLNISNVTKIIDLFQE